ncbi:MAG: hypothetical protein PWP31_297 [Clostridia bacterium]|nr:hypothetical protein [Clostridia bacterium]
MRWLGHASFYLESPEGVRLVTDPFGPEVFPVPSVNADIVTISHEHFDHNHLDGIKGEPQVWRGLTPDGADWENFDKSFKDIHAYTVPAYHDKNEGSQRGKNAVFVLEMGDMRLVHLGDLGHLLNEEQVKQIGRVDLLMLPVGGYFTIDAEEAWQIIEALKPKVIVPMHYLVEGMENFPIAGVDNFLGDRKNVRHFEEIDLSSVKLPEQQEIWVFERSKS